MLRFSTRFKVNPVQETALIGSKPVGKLDTYKVLRRDIVLGKQLAAFGPLDRCRRNCRCMNCHTVRIDHSDRFVGRRSLRSFERHC
jgi:hypothetical protein